MLGFAQRISTGAKLLTTAVLNAVAAPIAPGTAIHNVTVSKQGSKKSGWKRPRMR